MSTSETVEFPLGACPCGHGQIVRCVTTQDNPWSSADIHVSIDCKECKSIWSIEHNKLVQCSSTIPYREARSRATALREKFHDVVIRLVDLYFEKFSAKTKKAEHAEMVRFGIFRGNYRDFLKRKAEGKSPGQICAVPENDEWLRGLARESSIETELDGLRIANEEAERLAQLAFRQIIRRPLP